MKVNNIIRGPFGICSTESGNHGYEFWIITYTSTCYNVYGRILIMYCVIFDILFYQNALSMLLHHLIKQIWYNRCSFTNIAFWFPDLKFKMPEWINLTFSKLASYVRQGWNCFFGCRCASKMTAIFEFWQAKKPKLIYWIAISIIRNQLNFLVNRNAYKAFSIVIFTICYN